MFTNNVIIGSILGWIAFGTSSVLMGLVWALLKRVAKLEQTTDTLNRELEEMKRK
jgi:hypothetical protein